MDLKNNMGDSLKVSAEPRGPTDEKDEEVEQLCIANLWKLDSVVDINDNGFHQRQRILQDICIETKS